MWDNIPACATDHWFYPRYFSLDYLYRESYIFSSTRDLTISVIKRECYLEVPFQFGSSIIWIVTV